MTRKEQLLRDIDTLRESIELNDIAKPELSSSDRMMIIQHSTWCMKNFAELIELAISLEQPRATDPRPGSSGRLRQLIERGLKAKSLRKGR
jgi:hypothetical protein